MRQGQQTLRSIQTAARVLRTVTAENCNMVAIAYVMFSKLKLKSASFKMVQEDLESCLQIRCE